MAAPVKSARGAAVIIIGGGVTGLSAGWWLARSGIDVLVIDKGIVGWEASGRNGGGVRVALDEAQFKQCGRAIANAAHHGFSAEMLDPAALKALVPLAGDNAVGGY